MSKEIFYTKEERDTISVGTMIKDVEDGDFWYEGEWLGNDEYFCTAVRLDEDYYTTNEEDDKVGTIQKVQWYYVTLLHA
jgi:hypothetical protein